MVNKKTPKQPRKKVVFSIQADPGSEVFVAGTFNDWNAADKKLADKLNNGNFSVSVMLAPGRYQYKFVVNGEWRADGSREEWVANEFGTLNSVIVVK